MLVSSLLKFFEMTSLHILELVEVALFGYLSVFEYDYSVALLDSGESVSDHNGGSSYHDVL